MARGKALSYVMCKKVDRISHDGKKQREFLQQIKRYIVDHNKLMGVYLENTLKGKWYQFYGHTGLIFVNSAYSGIVFFVLCASFFAFFFDKEWLPSQLGLMALGLNMVIQGLLLRRLGPWVRRGLRASLRKHRKDLKRMARHFIGSAYDKHFLRGAYSTKRRASAIQQEALTIHDMKIKALMALMDSEST